MIRNFFAGILLLAATLCVLAGSVLQWADRTAGSPDSTRQLVQEIAKDETIRGAATDVIRSSIEQRFPDSVDKVPGLRATLKNTIDAGVGAAMSDAEVQSAWELTLNDTRATLLKDLTDYGSGRTRTPPSVTINLDPLISRVWQNIRSTAGSDVSDLMDRIELPSGVQVKVADIPAQQADQASQILALASYWWLFHVAAGLLLVGGLLLGTRIGRWVLLAVFSLLGMLAIVATRGMSGMITVPNRGNQLIWALENRITNHLTASLASSLDPLWYGYLGLMVVGLVVAVVKSVRKPA